MNDTLQTLHRAAGRSATNRGSDDHGIGQAARASSGTVVPAHDAAPPRVFITGGTSGLGLALLRAFHARGAQCAFVARHADAVARVEAELPGTHGLVGDVGVKDDIHRLALQVTGRLGGLDLLINNASTLGPVPLRPLADTDCEDLEATLAVNLLGPFRLTKALLGALAASARQGRGGHVVNVVSDAAMEAYPDWGAYSTSKAALAHLSRIWDAELSGTAGVQVRYRDPGDMDTPMHAAAVPDADRSALARPADVAAAWCDEFMRALRPGIAASAPAR